MNIKTNHSHIHTNSDQRRSPDLQHIPQKSQSSQLKNTYIGLTLMEYFKINNSKDPLQEIDQESNSSISAGTPCFAENKDKINFHCGSKMGRRDKIRIQTQQQLLPQAKEEQDQGPPRMATIYLDQLPVFDKNVIKLPSIHQHRHVNNSRQGMVKDGKLVNKKQSWKGKNEQNNSHSNNSSMNKQVQKARIHQFQKNALIMKKSIRTRVTSTSFYHPNIKERERQRIKTEDDSIDKNLQKSFIVTKYGGLSMGTKKSKQESNLLSLKKNQNTFKLLKKNNT